ncbi:PKD domain-containing protein [Nakamurella flava]|uniref:PKD domain-containing protein n=1 Tax=Nakamurella flava TaxID=2576308 RepID=UPI0023EF53FE|nr:PKD domain-containing protein [Nakamurella flava]
MSPVLSPTADQLTADALPTVQVDGMVWSQATIGTTVYAGGSFANARPAGAAAGTNQTPRANLLAYDITTGALKTGFVPPALNGQVLAVAVSPDGKRVYAGGDFLEVGGSTVRNGVAAFDATTGALISTFSVNIKSSVRAIVATNDTVYVGGKFTSANGQARTRFAAYQASNGALTAWAPTADYTVNAMVLSPDGSRLIVGGAFQFINGAAAYGLAAIDATTGELLPYAANQKVRNAGTNSAITSLSTDGSSVYGTGYHYGAGGNLEGTFAADPVSGEIRWIEDCHGDTYSVWATSAAVYTTSHAHYCGNIGGFFQSDPWSTNQRFALAFSKGATGTITADPHGYTNWQGNPSPSLINWFPDFQTGKVSGQNQAGWNIVGSGQYISVGGEFPTVNGAGQQGLVRFATKPPAPGKSGPVLTGSKFVPNLVVQGPGTVRVGFQANWDRDDMNLTYKVVRNSNTAAPVYTTTATSTYWDRPSLGFTDTGLAPGDYRYRLYVLDKDGNQVAGDTAYVTVPTAPPGPTDYVTTVRQQGASSLWRLGEATGSWAYDSAGYSDASVGTAVTRGAPGSLNGDPNTASTFTGTTDSRVSAPSLQSAPTTFSTSAWFRTTTTSGGRIVGFGRLPAGASVTTDRHVYMTNDGKLTFGVSSGGTRRVLSSPKSYNDGQWHQVVSTLGPNGMTLFVDGVQVGQRTDTTTGAVYPGFWRIGGDNLSGWASRPTKDYFIGDIDDVSIYPTALSPDDVIAQWVASGRVSPVPAAPADAYGAAVYRDAPTLYWRLAESSGVTAADSGRQLNSGTYRGAVTLGAAGALSGVNNAAVTVDGTTGVVTSDNKFSNPTTYSAEVWFKTTTARGGKLIGFGSAQQGLSASYDRHVYMQNDGRLVFGTYTGVQNLVTSPASYNDGRWHQVVATQGAGGMKLYVDGAVVGTNPQAGAQNYDGYWRIGGDRTWGSTSSYLAGSLDEAAVYPSVLSAQQVADHYALGQSGALPNRPPTASFTSGSQDLSLSVDGSGSSDSDGSVKSWAWSFGDGGSGSGATASHTYAGAGTYTVSLTVTDDKGLTGVSSQQVTVTAPPPNAPPVAAFDVTSAGLTATVDGTGSSDSDGSVKSYEWSFGDGGSDSGATAVHTYGSAGSYQVTLKVTDDDGASSSVSKSVTVTAPPPVNKAPVAAFTETVSGLAASFDGGSSSDADGSVSAWAWDFGDNSAETGRTASHTYGAAGTYQVSLTVTDNQGATNTVTRSVTVSNPATPTAYVSDAFGRAVSGGLGSAETGGAWTLNGSASQFSVANGTGNLQIAKAGSGPLAWLNSVSASDLRGTVDFTYDKASTGGGTYTSVAVRRVGTSDYRFKVRIQPSSVQIQLAKVVNGTETVLRTQTVSGMTWAPGDVLRLGFQAQGVGTTTLSAKVWKSSAAEPAGWQSTVTDAESVLQGPGAVGLQAYLAGTATNAPVVASFDNLTITTIPLG